MKKFTICGMIRSGTTLVAKMIDAHPHISVCVDPYMNFFKGVRNRSASDIGLCYDDREPISGNTYPENIDLLKSIYNFNYKLNITEEEKDNIRVNISRHIKKFAPKIIHDLKNVKGNSFEEYYSNLLLLAEEKYGNKESILFGTKECWSERFVYSLANLYKDMKFIFIVRDPRAVISSQNSIGKGQKHPFLLLVRQWRDSVAHIYILNKIKNINSVIIKYEQLIANPEDTMRFICKFLSVEFSYDMLNVSRFKDGKGNNWNPNTSYGEGKNEVYKSSLWKWKEKLTTQQVRFIETLCAAEMRLWSYQIVEEPLNFNQLCFSNSEVSYNDLPEWIKSLDIVQHIIDRRMHIEEMGKELFRLSCLNNNIDTYDEIVKKIIEEEFLNIDYFIKLRKNEIK